MVLGKRTETSASYYSRPRQVNPEDVNGSWSPVQGQGTRYHSCSRRRSLRTSANLLVMNLAVSDLLMVGKTPIFIYNCLHFGPVLGELGCSLYGFVGGLTGTVSIVTLAAIAVDRYNVIVHPLVRQKRRSIYWSIIFTWLYGGIFSSLPLLNIGFNRYTPEGFLTSCSFDYLDTKLGSRVMIIVFFCAAWALPFIVISVCYTGICRAVLETRKRGNITRTQRHCKEEEKRRTELRLAVVVIGVVALWFVAWTPYAIVALLGASGHQHLITPLSSMVPALFCKAASCIDPFVYAVTHPRFRRELQNLLYRRRLQKTREPSWGADTQRRESVEEMVVVLGRGDPQDMVHMMDPLYPGVVDGFVKPPSWFRSPFYTNSDTRRSTSLRLKPKQTSITNVTRSD